MKKTHRILFIGALMLMLGAAACAPATQPPISNQAATLAAQLTSSPIAAATQSTQGTGTPSAGLSTGTPAAAISMTPGIPVTGSGAALLICQFCLDQIPYAIVAIPEKATFTMVDNNGVAIQPSPSDATGCENVQTFNGRQLILCRGAGLATINLNVCNDSNDCTQFPVKLQECPQAGGGSSNVATLPAGTATITPGAVNTNTPSVPTSTPTP